MYAVASQNDLEIIKALIDSGADIYVKDNQGKTALDYANNEEVKKIILDAAR